MINCAHSSTAFVKQVGFSNGCAELAPKNPPPLVPICLIPINAAAGPRETDTVSPCSVVIVSFP